MRKSRSRKVQSPEWIDRSCIVIVNQRKEMNAHKKCEYTPQSILRGNGYITSLIILEVIALSLIIPWISNKILEVTFSSETANSILTYQIILIGLYSASSIVGFFLVFSFKTRSANSYQLVDQNFCISLKLPECIKPQP